MIEACLIGALGLTAALVFFAFWQARRADKATDRLIELIVAKAALDIAYTARGTAIEERDRTITALEEGSRRLRAALAASENAIPVPSPAATVKDSADAIRGALDGLSDLALAGARGVSEVPIVPSRPLKNR